MIATPRNGGVGQAQPDRRQFVLGAGLLGATGIGTILLPPQPATTGNPTTLDSVIPLTIGRYRYEQSSGVIQPLASELRESIYDQVLTRVYTAPDALPPLMLLVAYGAAQTARAAVHRPMACYESSGYVTSRIGAAGLSGLAREARDAVFFTATRADRSEQIYFWIRIGTRFPGTPLAEKIDIVAANLQGRLPSGVLVRLSVLSSDPDRALAQMQAFNIDLLRSLSPIGRALLLGTGRD